MGDTLCGLEHGGNNKIILLLVFMPKDAVHTYKSKFEYKEHSMKIKVTPKPYEEVINTYHL